MKKQTFYLATGLLASALLGGLTSCSKNDSLVAPTPETASTSTADVQVVDGRLMFKDFKSFQQTMDLLKSKSESDIATWEQGLHFTSLRTSTSEAQTQLKEEFRFPTAYAAMLNPQGEFQIGSKSYWFHSGQKLQFNSVADLKAAEAGQKVAFVATPAGYKVVSTGANPGSTTTAGTSSRMYLNSAGGVDARYQYQFNLWNDAGAVRKIIYETYVFTDFYSDIQQYHSVLAMNIKLEWRKSNGSWAVAGESRNIDVDFGGTASAYTSVGTQLKSEYFSVRTTGQSTSNTNFWLKDTWAFSANVNANSDIYWNYNVDGRISAWVSSDPGHTYLVQGANLW